MYADEWSVWFGCSLKARIEVLGNCINYSLRIYVVLFFSLVACSFSWIIFAEHDLLVSLYTFDEVGLAEFFTFIIILSLLCEPNLTLLTAMIFSIYMLKEVGLKNMLVYAAWCMCLFKFCVLVKMQKTNRINVISKYQLLKMLKTMLVCVTWCVSVYL